MSRGLGQHQRLFLAVLVRLERETGERRWHPIADVLNAMWNVEFRPGREERQRRQAEWEATWQADIDHRAAAGEPEAVKKQAAAVLLKRLDAMIAGRRAPQRVRDDAGSLESEMNPSRVIRLLRARGLLERLKSTSGPGSYVKLTDAGAAVSVGSLFGSASAVRAAPDAQASAVIC